MKSKESIKLKWEKKLVEMRKKAELKYSVLLSNRKKQIEKNWAYEIEKNERKKRAYINKKEWEYKRKMLNEIREMENKPKRVYKSDWPNIKPLQFALELAQENARLRDTDENWNWPCISHATRVIFPWWGLAGGHRFSRKFTTLCLEPENINAQCHECNNITWPLWNVKLKALTNEKYDENLEKKFGEWTVAKLKKMVSDFTHWTAKAYDLKKKIPELIEENERLWKTKNFYKPKRNWRKTWDEYVKRH